jgi:alpha/beta superfamily hydrolase
MPHDHAVTPCTLRTSDSVDLEAELALPASPSAAVVLAHPHPLHGGDMRSLVTSELFRLLPERGIAALRFNFRGVGGSGGEHGGGRDERLDLVAAIDSLSAAVPGVLLIVSGWSFGGDVSLSVDDDRIAGWVPVAATLRILPLDELVAAGDQRPKSLIVPENDEFNPPDRCEPMVAEWTSTSIEVVPGAGHYLVGRTAAVTDLIEQFVRTVGG